MPASTLQLAGYWDTEDELADMLQPIHSDRSRIHLGTFAGDTIASDVEYFHKSHTLGFRNFIASLWAASLA